MSTDESGGATDPRSRAEDPRRPDDERRGSIRARTSTVLLSPHYIQPTVDGEQDPVLVITRVRTYTNASASECNKATHVNQGFFLPTDYYVTLRQGRFVGLCNRSFYSISAMSSGRSAWGGGAATSSSAVARAASPVAVKLHDVMDEELAAKLQREEQEQWQREVEGRFGGEDRQTGWCFVEVPAGNSSGVMSVIQQEVTVHDEDDDPDYTFALELQAQEAEEYDRMRRQEASSMERVRVIRQEDPKREEIRHTLQRYYDREAHQEFDPADVHTVRHGVDPLIAQSGAVAAANPTSLSGERPRRRDPDVYHDVYLDGAGWRVPKKQFAMKHSDRKSRHHRSKTSSSSSGNAPSDRI